MPFVANFRPSTHGFSFGNSFPSQPDKRIPTPFGDIAIGDASNGLCGGMAFAVRDYFEARIEQPSGSQPAPGHPLFDFIVDRLFASFDLPFGLTFRKSAEAFARNFRAAWRRARTRWLEHRATRALDAAKP